MTRKKSPLDHATNVTLRLRIDKKAVQRFEEEFSVDSDFDLLGRVDGVTRNYFLSRSVEKGNPPLHEQRILFEGACAKAKELQDCISRLSSHEQACLGVDMDTLAGLQDVLLLIEKKARFESRVEPDLSEGEDNPDKILQLFILDMHTIYREATGRYDRATRDAFINKYTNPFFRFLKIFLPADIKKADDTLARYVLQTVPRKKTP